MVVFFNNYVYNFHGFFVFIIIFLIPMYFHYNYIHCFLYAISLRFLFILYFSFSRQTLYVILKTKKKNYLQLIIYVNTNYTGLFMENIIFLLILNIF